MIKSSLNSVSQYSSFFDLYSISPIARDTEKKKDGKKEKKKRKEKEKKDHERKRKKDEKIKMGPTRQFSAYATGADESDRFDQPRRDLHFLNKLRINPIQLRYVQIFRIHYPPSCRLNPLSFILPTCMC